MNYTQFIDENSWKHMKTMEPEFNLQKEDPLYYDPVYLKQERKVFHELDVKHNTTSKEL